MSRPISIALLRKRCEQESALEYTAGLFDPVLTLALLEAVEAARVVFLEYHDADPFEPEEADLRDALARFDFGERP